MYIVNKITYVLLKYRKLVFKINEKINKEKHYIMTKLIYLYYPCFIHNSKRKIKRLICFIIYEFVITKNYYSFKDGKIKKTYAN